MLRFYTEVLGLEHLHYGLWEPEDERSLPGVRKAQARYANYLMTLIPAGVKTILDVGCGTGVMAAHLTQLGYTVEGLSPDPSHQRLFRARVPSPFHLLRVDGTNTDLDIKGRAGNPEEITCDDVIVRRTRRLKLSLRVMNPVAYWKEVSTYG